MGVPTLILIVKKFLERKSVVVRFLRGLINKKPTWSRKKRVVILKILGLIFEKFDRYLDEKLTWFFKSTFIKSNTHLNSTQHTRLFRLVINILTFNPLTKNHLKPLLYQYTVATYYLDQKLLVSDLQIKHTPTNPKTTIKPLQTQKIGCTLS